MLTRRSDSGVWVSLDDAMFALDHDGRPAVGERRLMVAVVAHALRSLFRDAAQPGRGAARRLRQDLQWLTSPNRSDPFAFERICEAIGLDPARIRDRILQELGMQTAVAARTRLELRSSAFPSRPAAAVG
jgi:hypothetical protein